MSATLYRADPTIRREDRRGPERAARGSVRWKYVGSPDRASRGRETARR
jgi:hypothetical protein